VLCRLAKVGDEALAIKPSGFRIFEAYRKLQFACRLAAYEAMPDTFLWQCVIRILIEASRAYSRYLPMTIAVHTKPFQQFAVLTGFSLIGEKKV